MPELSCAYIQEGNEITPKNIDYLVKEFKKQASAEIGYLHWKNYQIFPDLFEELFKKIQEININSKELEINLMDNRLENLNDSQYKLMFDTIIKNPQIKIHFGFDINTNVLNNIAYSNDKYKNILTNNIIITLPWHHTNSINKINNEIDKIKKNHKSLENYYEKLNILNEKYIAKAISAKVDGIILASGYKYKFNILF